MPARPACQGWLLLLLLAILARGPAASAQETGPHLGGAPPSVEPPTSLQSAAESSRGEASVIVQKTAPASLNIGKPLVIDMLVRNTGQAPAYQVQVVDLIPRGARYVKAEPAPEIKDNQLIWRWDTLEAGSQKKLKVELEPLEEIEITSKAIVTFSTEAVVKTRITRPQLAVKKTGPELVTVGDSATFHIEVSNPGTGPATGVIIRDQLPAGLRHPQGDLIEADIGTLAPGASKTLDLTVKAVSPGKFLNEVTAVGDDNLRATASAPIRVGQALLQLAKTGPSQRYVNAEAVFTLEVSNPGDAPARNVELVDALPFGLRFVEASDGGHYDQDSNCVQWTLGELKPSEKRRLTLKTVPTITGELRNQAVVKGQPSLKANAQFPLNVIGVPALMLEVVDRDDPLEVGGQTCYEIRVLNQGTAVNTNVQIVALIPEGMAATGVESDVAHKIQGQQVIFTPLPRFAPKADLVFRICVQGEAPGDYRFKVQLSSDQLRIPVCEEESTHVYDDGTVP